MRVSKKIQKLEDEPDADSEANIKKMLELSNEIPS